MKQTNPETTAEQILTNLRYWLDKEPAKQVGFFCTTLIILSNPHSNPFNTQGCVRSTMDFWTEVQEKIKNYEFKD